MFKHCICVCAIRSIPRGLMRAERSPSASRVNGSSSNPFPSALSAVSAFRYPTGSGLAPWRISGRSSGMKPSSYARCQKRSIASIWRGPML